MLSNYRQSPIKIFQSPFNSSPSPFLPFLFPLHRILGIGITIFTLFCRLLMPFCRALALPRRSLTPSHTVADPA